MEATGEKLTNTMKLSKINIRAFVSQVPLLGWLLGALIAVALEHFVGTPFARALGLPKALSLFGFLIILKKPLLIPSAAAYVLLIYILPIGIVARSSASMMNKLVGKLLDFPMIISVLIHLGMLYLVLHLWSDMSLYQRCRKVHVDRRHGNGEPEYN